MNSADGSNQISKFPKFHKTVHVISQRFKASGRQSQLTFLATLTRVRHWPGINWSWLRVSHECTQNVSRH